ncbi:DUF885 domain-containing protein [Chitinophaga ginsengisegetis]|uniref:DUF885 domain-containing protein n=1 Tax=Chitinophaga ginsengisegetis TaxID=393003 RepID=UPI000DBA056D|nr:DUF885 domain-containing protein [Chitinophaga ginsengisegetis]MDR6571100.1 uncharacterized protein (DUF885 family) [Chitinophaga ginsengisegetis]MDR6650834.1 uncharacterized protein (DUF885 family) [Chitinophaga ginsengisegetis]MDR6657146.1 uncharacterized protein (DUF885 family) [Chitinophaga ginsengisegetis]
MSKKRKVQLFLLLIASTLYVTVAQAQQNNEKLHRLFDHYYNERMQLFPTEATSAGDHRYDDLLSNDGAGSHIAATGKFYQQYLDALKKVDRTSLNTPDRISYDILKDILTTGQESLQLHLEYLPMNQFVSTPLELAQFGSGSSAQPFNTVKDYEHWAKRMTAFMDWTDTTIANFNKGIRAGIVLPKALVLQMIPQMEALADNDTAKNVFYKPLSQFPASFAAAEKQRITTLYHRVIATSMVPAYRKLAVYLKDTYLPAAQDHAGLSALPGGDRIYQYYLRLYTTSPGLTPEKVYQTGLEEVARITKEMETIKAKVGFKGSLADFFHYLRTDARFMPFKTPEQVLDAYRTINNKVQPALAALFGHQPKTPFVIKRVEAYREASQGGPFYIKGNLQENIPATFYVPVPDATKINVTFQGMEATFIHEAIPGHHFQIASQQENNDIPAFRRQPAFYAYFEGWALYCESLGEQLGCYTDPFQKMGALNMEIHRAIRLVTDVAIHTGKMTREEAIAYMMQHESISEPVATAEVERYMAMPGQALSYKTGELKIKALRDTLAAKLGSKFSLKDFHDALLGNGDMPLNVLEDYMNSWAQSYSEK